MTQLKLGWSSKGYTWRKRDGSFVLVKNMSNQHVLNTVRMLERKYLDVANTCVSTKCLRFLDFFRNEATKRGLK